MNAHLTKNERGKITGRIGLWQNEGENHTTKKLLQLTINDHATPIAIFEGTVQRRKGPSPSLMEQSICEENPSTPFMWPPHQPPTRAGQHQQQQQQQQQQPTTIIKPVEMGGGNGQQGERFWLKVSLQSTPEDEDPWLSLPPFRNENENGQATKDEKDEKDDDGHGQESGLFSFECRNKKTDHPMTKLMPRLPIPIDDRHQEDWNQIVFQGDGILFRSLVRQEEQKNKINLSGQR